MCGTTGGGGEPGGRPSDSARDLPEDSATAAAEQQARADDVLASPRRMQTLVDALLTVGTDLDLTSILERVVRSACLLVDARYGVLLLATPDREVTDFMFHGLTDAERDQLGSTPDFHGVLDLLFQTRQPVRLAEVDGDLAALGGFPSAHPPVRNLLGVPIAMRDETYGQLYAGNKQTGPAFTLDDEKRVLALATAAGIAIQNARLFEQERRRQQWLEAASEIIHLLLGQVDRDKALRTVTRKLREISGADYGGLILVDPSRPGTFRHEAVEGLGLEGTSGGLTPMTGLPAAVVTSGRAIVTTDLPNEPGHNPPPQWREALSVLGLGMVLPMIASGETIGVLYAGWRKDSPSAQLAAAEVAQVEMFASQAALALQQVEGQENRSRLSVLEDRDRIARDLHDAVIQRLFATGTRLHSAFGLSTRTEVRQRITDAIAELDQTTQEVRTAIFQLHDHVADDVPSLRERLVSEVDSTHEMFGFTPRLVVSGRLEDLEPSDGRNLVTVVREALGIAAKFDSPSRVEVVIRAGAEGLELAVVDDGHSEDQAQAELHEAALTNLAARVTRLGGGCHVRQSNGETILEWHVR